MCELFGVTANRKIKLNSLLREFFSHSPQHPNGWGIATFDGQSASIEREPVRAIDSLYLKNRLSARLEASSALAHIRKATIGAVNYNNSHPFTKKDESGRSWTLIHNGTIFESPKLSPYQYKQEGSTDSERILLYIVDQVNRHFMEDLNLFDVNERMYLIENIITELSPENKLNLILFDGEYMYVHTNAAGTLHMKERFGCTIFSTTPLDEDEWEEIPHNQLLVYKEGSVVFTGTRHPYSYVEDPEKIASLYLGYAEL